MLKLSSAVGAGSGSAVGGAAVTWSTLGALVVMTFCCSCSGGGAVTCC